MSKILVFGDSYSAFYLPKKKPEFIEYKEFRGGNFPKTWFELLSEKMNIEFVNLAVGGASNYEILQTFCDNLDKIDEGDYVFLGWSYYERFRLYDETQQIFCRIVPSTNQDIYGISQNTIDEILVNRTNKNWIDEVYSWEKMMEKLSKCLNFSLFLWTFDGRFKKHGTMWRDLKGMGAKTIKEETNGKIDDLHMGEIGHKIQSEYFYKIFINKQII